MPSGLDDRGGSRIVLTIFMEIMRRRDGATQPQFSQAAPANVNHALLFLQRPLDHQQRRAMEHRAIRLKQIRSDYYIGDSGFVFERDEEETLRSAWPLTHDDRSRGFHPFTILRISQFHRTEYSARPQPLPQMRHQMRSRRPPGGCVTRERLLDRPHLRQRHASVLRDVASRLVFHDYLSRWCGA